MSKPTTDKSRKESDRQYRIERVRRLKEAGLCTRCGKNSPLGGGFLCVQCGDRKARARSQRIVAGICVNCPKPSNGRTRFCDEHHQKSNESKNARTAKLLQAGLCVVCGQRPPETKRLCNECAGVQRSCQIGRHQKLRARVLAGYGHKCQCCGEPHAEFLAVDHVNGGGNRERKEHGWRVIGRDLYRKIVKLNFPDTYRLLCHNCNNAYGHYGYCPHQLKV